MLSSYIYPCKPFIYTSSDVNIVSLLNCCFMKLNNIAIPGDRGPAGNDGEKGERGEPGRTGVAGIPGAKGAEGTAGVPGLVGKPGIVGLPVSYICSCVPYTVALLSVDKL